MMTTISTPVVHVVQPKSLWCWAACVLMVVRAKGGKVGQHLTLENLVERVVGDRNVNITIDDHFVKSAFFTFGITATAHKRQLTPDEVRHEVGSDRPFLIGYAWKEGGGHLIVADGYEAKLGTIFLSLHDPGRDAGASIIYDSLVGGTYDTGIQRGEGNKWDTTFTVTW